MDGSPEAALVRRCQAGDKEAFRLLVEQHRSVLFGTAYLMTQERSLAEDAVQEALIKIWRHLPSFRFQGSIKAWLVRIVVNEVKQLVRKKRVATVPLEEAAGVADDTDSMDVMLVHNEERRSLRHALDRLPPEHREAVVLHYFSDLTVPEIAMVMGEREGTIKSRLSRALDKLGVIMRDDRSGEEGR